MPGQIQCPSCQKQYAWNALLAGKVARCKCGNTIAIPKEDPSQTIGVVEQAETAGGDIYAVAEPPPGAAAPMARTAPPPLPVATAGAAPRAGSPISYATPRRVRCQVCGADAPTKFVEFHQNVGALVMRFRRRIRGNLCKQCINQYFWKMTGTTIAVGWLGVISLVIAPIFVINNIVRYIGCIKLPSSYEKS